MRSSPALHVRKIGPTKPSEVEIGAFYRMAGTGSMGDFVPEQVIWVMGPPRPAPFISFATLVCSAWVFCLINGMEGMMDYHQHDYPLACVNVEGKHNHDRHLERIELDPESNFHKAIHRRLFGTQGVVI